MKLFTHPSDPDLEYFRQGFERVVAPAHHNNPHTLAARGFGRTNQVSEKMPEEYENTITLRRP